MRVVLKYLKGCHKKDGEKLFSLDTEGRTRGNGFKLQHSRFRLNLRKNFLTVRTVGRQNRLPVEAPSLEVFKRRLESHLPKMVQTQQILHLGQRIRLDDLYGPFYDHRGSQTIRDCDQVMENSNPCKCCQYWFHCQSQVWSHAQMHRFRCVQLFPFTPIRCWQMK